MEGVSKNDSGFLKSQKLPKIIQKICDSVKYLHMSEKSCNFAPSLGAYGKEERNSKSRIGINPAVGEH